MSADDRDYAVQSKSAKDLCISCGLCCNGYVFRRVCVEKEEVGALQSLGLKIYEEDDESFFRQPCPAHACNSCSIYADRPKTCVGFKCILLNKLLAQEIELHAALDVVTKFKELMRRLDALAAPVNFASDTVNVTEQWKRINDLIETVSDRSSKNDYAKLALLLLVAKRQIEENFVLSKPPEEQAK